MEYNRTLVTQSGSIGRLGQILAGCGPLHHLLLVTDPVLDKVYGQQVMDQLAALGPTQKLLVEYNSLAASMDLAETVIGEGVDCIVGLGGGKVLDVCKYAAHVTRTLLLSIPTTLSNDGIASPVAALKQKDGRPRSLNCVPPKILVLDPEVILSGPAQLTRAGIGDTLSKLTALDDWKFACEAGKDTMNGYACMLAQTSLDVLLHTRHSQLGPALIDDLGHSLVLSGVAMEFAGSSRPVSGSEHLFSHALDFLGETRNLHGYQVALGVVAVKKLLGEDPAPATQLLDRFSIDVNPARLGIGEDLFVRAMEQAPRMRKNRYTRLHALDLSPSRLRQVYGELCSQL